jgi:hypothetical protein
MVDVIDVFDHFCDSQIDDPPNPECVTLGKCKGYCIMWPKKEIKLISTSNFSISSAKRQKLDQSSINSAELTVKSRQVEGYFHGFHIPGNPLVLEDEYVLLPTEMRTLHDNIMTLENDDRNTANFMGLAPNDYNFTAGKLTDIFCMFNLGMLGASLIRLWALYQAKEATRNKEPIFAVIDPFHFHEDNLKKGFAATEMIAQWLCNAMQIHKDKQYLLVP